jgi:hypothetical protein
MNVPGNKPRQNQCHERMHGGNTILLGINYVKRDQWQKCREGNEAHQRDTDCF